VAKVKLSNQVIRNGQQQLSVSMAKAGWSIPPFLVVQGVNHLKNWYSESALPYDWVITPTTNGWTNNETGLDWLKHLDKHTALRAKGIPVYQMLVLDGHESHESAAFQEYCKSHNIITLGLPAHSSHLTQPLDVGCFAPLKQAYSRQIEGFIKAHINHITKLEFFMALKLLLHKLYQSKAAKLGSAGPG
jgi:hypothetical protein